MQRPFTYDHEKYRIVQFPHLLLLHWILNPGLAINEVFFGQRIPQITLIDKLSNEPLIHRQFVPCPHCGTLHKGILWGGANAFGHWFGLICPTCKGKIPCLWNLTSLLILGVTFPIWMVIKAVFEKRYIEHELKRLAQNAPTAEVKLKKSAWMKT